MPDNSRYAELVQKLDVKLICERDLGIQFTGKVSQKQWAECRNPFKRDERPSAGVYIGSEPHRGQFKAFNDAGSVRDRMNFYDLCDQLHPRIGGSRPHEIYDYFAEQVGIKKKSKIVKAYNYTDENGTLIHQTVRFDPKDFKQRRPDGKGGWIWSLGQDVFLYNLPAVIKADTVYVVEGEKDADRLISEGLTATTCPMGAGKWHEQFTKHLNGKNVIIIPDCDEAGQSHARQIANSLLRDGSGGIVKILTLPGLSGKQDVTDWLHSGKSKADLVQIAKDTPLYDPSKNPCENPPAAGLAQESRTFDLIPLSKIDLTPIEWLVRDLFEKDSLAVVFGDSAVGKSFFAIDLSSCIATGLLFHGRKVKPGAVVYVAGEGKKGLKRRFIAWSLRHSINLDDAPIYISTVPAKLSDSACTNQVIEAVQRVEKQAGPVSLVVLDTLARNFGPGDENSTKDMGSFLAEADAIRLVSGATVLICHHTGLQDKYRGRGNYSLKCGVDAEYRMDKDEFGIIRVEPLKMKDAPKPDPFALELIQVDLPGLKDEDGRLVTSAVLVDTPFEPKQDNKKSKITGTWQLRAMEVLNHLFTDRRKNLIDGGFDPYTARVSVEDWKEAFLSSTENDVERRKAQKAWYVIEKNGDNLGFRIEKGFVEIY